MTKITYEDMISILDNLPLQQLEELTIAIERAMEKIESDEKEPIEANINREPDNS